MRIIWSEDAQSELGLILEYGAATFGERAAGRFYREVLDNEVRLLSFPCMGKIEPLLAGRPQNFRSLVIHKHYKLIYYIDEDTIYIAALIDTRADPDSLTEKLG